MSCGVNFYLSVGLQFGHGKKTSRNERTLVKTCWRGFRRSLRTSPASLTYLVMTSFDSISGNVSTLEVKTNTHGQPSGARACGKRRHPAWWVGEGSPRETLTVLRHASCGSGTRMTGDNPCLCSGWAVSFMSGSLLSHVFRLVSPQGSRYLRALLCSHLLVLS